MSANSGIFITMQRNASTDELYFAALTVVDWIDVFTRRYYNDYLIDSTSAAKASRLLAADV